MDQGGGNMNSATGTKLSSITRSVYLRIQTRAWQKQRKDTIAKIISCVTGDVVLQEVRGARTEVILGLWDEEDHIKWLQNHPSKQPKNREYRRLVLRFLG